ncbi:MAG: hypothetical protein FWG51_03335 [Firmicutes bacterium]|nr:hypothetical protein [Bacillota bacterium]
MKKILFVCTGNTCRSPMAEAVACKLIKDKNFSEIQVCSAGVNVNFESHMEQNAKDALITLGIDNFEHVPRQFQNKMLSGFNLILTMTKEQKEIIGDYENVLTVEEYTSCNEIADPFGQSLESYIETLNQIVKVVDIIIQKITDCVDGEKEDEVDEREAGLRRNLMEAIAKSEINTVGSDKESKVDENNVNMNSVEAGLRRNLMEAMEKSEINNVGGQNRVEKENIMVSSNIKESLADEFKKPDSNKVSLADEFKKPDSNDAENELNENESDEREASLRRNLMEAIEKSEINNVGSDKESKVDENNVNMNSVEASLRRNLMEAIEKSEINNVGRNKEIIDENKININSVDAGFRRNLMEALAQSQINTVGRDRGSKVDENNVNMNSIDAGFRRNLMEALKSDSSAENSAKESRADKKNRVKEEKAAKKNMAKQRKAEKSGSFDRGSSNFRLNSLDELKNMDSKKHRK